LIEEALTSLKKVSSMKMAFIPSTVMPAFEVYHLKPEWRGTLKSVAFVSEAKWPR